MFTKSSIDRFLSKGWSTKHGSTFSVAVASARLPLALEIGFVGNTAVHRNKRMNKRWIGIGRVCFRPNEVGLGR